MVAFLKWLIYLALAGLSLSLAGGVVIFLLSISAVVGGILIGGFVLGFVAWIIKEIFDSYKKT